VWGISIPINLFTVLFAIVLVQQPGLALILVCRSLPSSPGAGLCTVARQPRKPKPLTSKSATWPRFTPTPSPAG
jgi:hypothetical protein